MTSDIHSLSGAYAIDALSEEEAADFRRHLAGCAVCREEVAGLRAAAARMGASKEVAPPPELRSKVLAAARRTPQEPPRPTLAAPAASEPRRRSWAPRILAAAAAAVLVAAIGIGVGVLGGDDGPGTPDTPLAEGVVQVFEAPDRRVAEVETGHGTVRVAASPGRNEMAVDARDLESPGEGRVYQLWSVAEEGAVSVGLLDDDTVGASMPMPSPGTEVAITVEPAGGSPQPTGEQVVQVDPGAL